MFGVLMLIMCIQCILKKNLLFAESFIKTLKTETYKCMTSISKIVYIAELDDIVNKCNNTYHSTIKMKPVNVESNTCKNS